MTTVYLREERELAEGGYLEVWMIPPPAEGIRYQVIQQEWNEDHTERRIHEIRLVDTETG